MAGYHYYHHQYPEFNAAVIGHDSEAQFSSLSNAEEQRKHGKNFYHWSKRKKTIFYS
jgi:hypothetical protein